jgi:hypothetical protein
MLLLALVTQILFQCYSTFEFPCMAFVKLIYDQNKTRLVSTNSLLSGYRWMAKVTGNVEVDLTTPTCQLWKYSWHKMAA